MTIVNNRYFVHMIKLTLCIPCRYCVLIRISLRMSFILWEYFTSRWLTVGYVCTNYLLITSSQVNIFSVLSRLTFFNLGLLPVFLPRFCHHYPSVPQHFFPKYLCLSISAGFIPPSVRSVFTCFSQLEQFSMSLLEWVFCSPVSLGWVSSGNRKVQVPHNVDLFDLHVQFLVGFWT